MNQHALNGVLLSIITKRLRYSSFFYPLSLGVTHCRVVVPAKDTQEQETTSVSKVTLR